VVAHLVVETVVVGEEVVVGEDLVSVRDEVSSRAEALPKNLIAALPYLITSIEAL
jgi:hypothetical protein